MTSPSSSELQPLLIFLPFTSTGALWPSDRADEEKEEGEDEHELGVEVGGYWET